LEAIVETQPEYVDDELYYEDEFAHGPQGGYDPRLDDVIGYLGELEADEHEEAARARDEELRRFGEANPNIFEPEVLDAVGGRLREIAETTGDESVLTDPYWVEQAYTATQAELAKPDDLEDRQRHDIRESGQPASVFGGHVTPEKQVAPEEARGPGFLPEQPAPTWDEQVTTNTEESGGDVASEADRERASMRLAGGPPNAFS
jgi:hypothetical protein